MKPEWTDQLINQLMISDKTKQRANEASHVNEWQWELVKKKKAFSINKKKFRKLSSDNFYFNMWISNCCSLPFKWTNNVMKICRKTPNPIILPRLIKNPNQASLCTYKPFCITWFPFSHFVWKKIAAFAPLSILIKDSSLYLKTKEVV